MRTIDDIKKQPLVSIISAIGASTRAIGKDGNLLWHIPDDMQHFKKLTSGHPVIMGRKTWESLPEKFRPLPERTNIVVTRQSDYEAAGVEVAGSLEEALAAASRVPGADEVFVIGGGSIYTLALPHANRIYLTLVDDEKEGDVFFPKYEKDFKVLSCINGQKDPPHKFLTLERK